MPTGPHAHATEKAKEATRRAFPHIGIVTSTPEKSSDEPAHHVHVAGETFTGETPAEIVVEQEGDVNPPAEGSRVLVQFVAGEDALVVGQLYSQGGSQKNTAPTYQPGERYLGHPTTDANVHFRPDGTIDVESANGASTVTVNQDGSVTVINDNGTLELAPDGTVSVDGGSTGVITDISTTKDGDGDVQSVDVTRSNKFFVP